MTRNMPDPLPIILLGRLAIDQKYHNEGLGSALLRDALIRVVSVANNTGVSAILVHALSEQARRFYLSRGFVESPLQPMTLMMTLETIRTVLRESVD
jgi:GNAT superfamily N-acetyltransferase